MLNNQNITNYTVVVTPPVGSAITTSGTAGDQLLKDILSKSQLTYTFNPATAVYSGTFSVGACCTEFSATPNFSVVPAVTIDPIVCNF